MSTDVVVQVQETIALTFEPNPARPSRSLFPELTHGLLYIVGLRSSETCATGIRSGPSKKYNATIRNSV